MTTNLRRIVLPLLLFTFAALLVVAGKLPAQGGAPAGAGVVSAEILPAATSTFEGGNCRFGVAAFDGQTAWVDTLKAGWWLNFSSSPGASTTAEYVYVIRVQPSGTSGYSLAPDVATLRSRVSSNPQRLWLVGNEIDRTGQDGVAPDVYARAYNEVYYLIKDEDPTAQVAISALVQVTPLRLAYLDAVWDSYREQFGQPMPVDVWNMHLYILPELNPDGSANEIASVPVGIVPYLTEQGETLQSLGKYGSGGVLKPGCSNAKDNLYCYAEHDNMTIFADQVKAMRQWMVDHGQRHKPLILSEYSLLYPYEDDGGSCFLADENGRCFDSARVSTFLTASLDHLRSTTDAALGMPADGNRLIQQSLWYSLWTDTEGSASNMLVSNYADFTQGSVNALNPVGTTFQNYINARTPNLNLVAVQAGHVVGKTNGGTASVSLPVTFYNAGNQRLAQQFTVSFFKGVYPANQGLIGSVTFTGEPEGCARRPYTATVTWNGLTAGVHNYWARVDNTDVVAETSNNDNIAQGVVFVDPKGSLNLPIMTRP